MSVPPRNKTAARPATSRPRPARPYSSRPRPQGGSRATSEGGRQKKEGDGTAAGFRERSSRPRPQAGSRPPFEGRRQKKEGEGTAAGFRERSSRPRPQGGSRAPFEGRRQKKEGEGTAAGFRERSSRPRPQGGSRAPFEGRRQKKGGDGPAARTAAAAEAARLNRDWKPPRDNPRAVAANLLRRLYENHLDLEELRADRLSSLPKAADRHLTHYIVMSALRWSVFLDGELAKIAARPLEDLPAALRALLHVGFVQLLFMRVPDYAAVNGVVEIAPPSKRGFVNALLRRCAERKADVLADLGKEETLDRCIPPVFFNQWKSFYGLAVTRRMIRSLLRIPYLDLCFKDPSLCAAFEAALAQSPLMGSHTAIEVRAPEGAAPPTKDLWTAAERFGNDEAPPEARRWPTGRGIRLWRVSGDPARLPFFKEGHWWVQDLAAAFMTDLLERLVGGLAGKEVFDMCAAPGGKTMGLLSRGATVLATDRAEGRLRRLRQNVRRLGLEEGLTALVQDSGEYFGRFDAVLLDAPCSGTGTLRRHPEGFLMKDPTDLGSLCRLQERLIRHGLSCLKPRGLLLYSVCSLEPAEGEHLVRRLLAKHKEIALVPFRRAHVSPFEEALSSEGWLRLMPHSLESFGGLDGFFAAAFVAAPQV